MNYVYNYHTYLCHILNKSFMIIDYQSLQESSDSDYKHKKKTKEDTPDIMSDSDGRRRKIKKSKKKKHSESPLTRSRSRVIIKFTLKLVQKMLLALNLKSLTFRM